MTATTLRKNLFQVLDGASQGRDVEVLHKGITFRIVLASPGSRLSKLISREDPVDLMPEDSGWDAQAQAAWEAEADELLGPAGQPAKQSK